jgi:hypothetical protein
MKSIIITIALALSTNFVFAQDEEVSVSREVKPLSTKLFVGGTGGWDSPFGQGAQASYLFKPHHLISIGGGVALWQSRFGVHYDLYSRKQMLGWSIGMGFSYGIAPKTKFIDSLPIIKDTSIVGNELFVIQPKAVLLWNLHVKKTFPLYKNGRYFFYAGYAQRLQPSYIIETNNDPENLAIKSFKAVSPGGFSAGAGILFGIR